LIFKSFRSYNNVFDTPSQINGAKFNIKVTPPSESPVSKQSKLNISDKNIERGKESQRSTMAMTTHIRVKVTL